MTNKKAVEENNAKRKSIAKLQEMDAEEIVTNVIGKTGSKNARKRKKFFTYHLIFGFNIAKSERVAGLSQGYGYDLMKKYKTSSRLRQEFEAFTSQFPIKYRAFMQSQLGRIAGIKDDILTKLEENPELAFKPGAGKLLKDMTVEAGASQPDGGMNVSVNINTEALSDFSRKIPTLKKTHDISYVPSETPGMMKVVTTPKKIDQGNEEDRK